MSKSLSYGGEPLEPSEQRFTTWLNPLSSDQRVDVHVNDRLVRYKIPAGGTKDIPSEFDGVIHKVVCEEQACKARGPFCVTGHKGVVIGGLAPQLVNQGAAESQSIAPALDTQKAEKLAADEALAAAALKTQAMQQATVIAAGRVAELEKAEKTSKASKVQ